MLKPLNCNVVIKKTPDVEKNKYGILLSPSIEEQERNDIGEVVAVADEVFDIEEGNKVLYSKFAGSTYKKNGEEYLIINFADILAVIE